MNHFNAAQRASAFAFHGSAFGARTPPLAQSPEGAPNLAICIPSRAGLSDETALALRENMDRLPHRVLTVFGKPVVEARNELGCAALATEAPYVVWADDDSWWCAGTLARMLNTMQSRREVDILSGYYGGRDHYSPPFAWRDWNDDKSIVDPGRNCALNAVERIQKCGFHFVLMRRNALQAVGALPFTPLSPEWTEDFSFLARAVFGAKLGLFVDTGARIAHIDGAGRAHTVGMPSGRIVNNRLELPPPPWPRPTGPRKLEPLRSYGLPSYGADAAAVNARG